MVQIHCLHQGAFKAPIIIYEIINGMLYNVVKL